MTNERDKADMDARVSEAYRELSAPRVPDHLNQRILRMAAKQSPGKLNSLFAKWMKPVTVTATIALSLAIVLELTEVPTTAIQMEAVPAIESQAESVREELTPQETDSLEKLVLKDTDLVKSEAKGRIDSFAASPSAAALPAARKLAADMPDSNQPATAACNEIARQSADTWLDCIDKLRESGFPLDADSEYEAFMLEYPAEAANSESNK
jgi:hypothetical protein